MPGSPPRHPLSLLTRFPVAYLDAPVEAVATELDVTPQERTISASMAPERAEEFLAGRTLVHRILRARWPGRERGFSLLQDAERRPVWPAGIVGSITHSGGWVVAALAEAGLVTGVGIDLQEAPDARAAEEAAPVVARRELARGLPLPLPEAVALVLSCKESLYKCLNPTLNAFMDFEDVEVLLNLAGGTADFIPHNPTLPWPRLPIMCRFALTDGWVESAAVSIETRFRRRRAR